ncbi:pyrroloquinoline quinone biosynthesis peptide chaperone PqqD [Streptomyces tendae]|uniref:pyrroloquinoline quinone biosynthesis peptide chaperone PqqD n=1 Tax=Streptomyces tendae TaxID=1932 RepID=UPI00371243EE
MTDDQPWRPAVPSAAVLRHDRTRGTDVLLLPERVVVLHGSGRGVLELCDGTRTVEEITLLVPDGVQEERVRREISSFLHRMHTEGCLR